MSAPEDSRAEERAAWTLKQATKAIRSAGLPRKAPPPSRALPCQGFTFKHVRRMVARAGLRGRRGAPAISKAEAFDATRLCLDAPTFRRFLLRGRKARARMEER